MTLEQLLKLMEKPPAQRPRVSADSRNIHPGSIFVAIKGTQVDGHDFIDRAVKKGAKYIVSQKPVTSSAQVILTIDTTHTFGQLCQAYFDNPNDKLTNLAVTGTNGKTTTTYLFRSIAANAGKKCALVGTVEVDFGDGQRIIESALTTPDAFDFASLASQMVDTGAEYMIAEASSHAIEQNRLAGINFSAAAFTNLTGDHLDYHKTMEAYLAAKLKLFEKLSSDSAAIINADDPVCRKVAAVTKAKSIFYSLGEKADITADIISMDITGTVFDLNLPGKKVRVDTPLIGSHNISNHLAAASLAYICGFSPEMIAEGLSKFAVVPGRLQKVPFSGDFTVLVDYAHTDDALKNVLNALRPLCKGRLTVVFGCGGDRDKTKRPRMAYVASQLADRIFVTSDNPRTEDPSAIINDILKGFSNPSDDKIVVQPDRKKAIQTAVNSAQTDDIIVIAGKGHENYQIIGTERKPFSDIDTAMEFLR
ncbi:MAG: UDP-N-acetylmuramoyl-L-alanyl-D-glutamate--2,6-diaminopimelate ligase [Sedimentisphaerales bacterium]|nr:UDP-N-acetylmuramoyl-L-alanyl-D-glutamate--2,6-diaminopimelate ligase [Sedimentisphaerales bacterium]